MTIRTKPPETYIPPTPSDIKAMAKQVGTYKYSKSLVQDLCNVQAGGDFISTSEIEKTLIKNVNKFTKTLYQAPDGDFKFRGEWIKENDRYISNLDKAHEFVVKKQTEYHATVQDFIRTLNFSNVPGYSPLEKSMGLLKLLSKQKGGCPNDSEDDELGSSLPIFTEEDYSWKDPKDLATRINEVLDNLDNLDEHEKILCNVSGSQGQLALAEDMMDGRDIMLQIKRELDKVCALQTTRHSTLKPDSNGTEVRYRSIKNLSEYPRLHPTEWMYPDAYKNYRLLNGVAQVRERYSKEEKKMLLYIICDCSGSMSGESGERFLKAGGVVMNRLKAVLRGEADCWLSFFHDELGEEFRASSENVSEVRELMAQIKASNFDAGGTSIARCTKQAVQRIEEKRKMNPKLIKPELLIITDGDDDTSSLKSSDLGGIRLHTVIVGGHNQHLLNVSRQSGGVGISRI